MPPRKTAPKPDPTEEAIRKAGSIGALERLAGIGSAQEDRVSFWTPFCKMPGAAGLDTGVLELKRRIRARAQPERKSRATKEYPHA
jgi:hypothetical protein